MRHSSSARLRVSLVYALALFLGTATAYGLYCYSDGNNSGWYGGCNWFPDDECSQYGQGIKFNTTLADSFPVAGSVTQCPAAYTLAPAQALREHVLWLRNNTDISKKETNFMTSLLLKRMALASGWVALAGGSFFLANNVLSANRVAFTMTMRELGFDRLGSKKANIQRTMPFGATDRPSEDAS